MGKKMNSFSIIIPTYNSDKEIVKTINSILQQNYDNYEVIIIDDGSKDKTKSCIDKYCKNDKIKYFYQENSGVSSARNKGLSKASNEYIMFVDSDDELFDNALITCNEYINKYDADLYSFGYICCTKKSIKSFNFSFFYSNNFDDYFKKMYSEFLFNPVWNKIYKKSIIEKHGILLDKEISIAEDLKFNINYCNYSNKYIHINKKLYKYNLSNNGLGLKFRLDSGYTKIDIDLSMKSKLIKQKDVIQFVDQIVIKDIFSFYSKIVDKRNKIKTNQKIELIKDVQRKYKCDIYKLESSSLKYNILLFFLKNNYAYIIFIIAMLANRLDQLNKIRKFGI